MHIWVLFNSKIYIELAIELNHESRPISFKSIMSRKGLEIYSNVCNILKCGVPGDKTIYSEKTTKEMLKDQSVWDARVAMVQADIK